MAPMLCLSLEISEATKLPWWPLLLSQLQLGLFWQQSDKVSKRGGGGGFHVSDCIWDYNTGTGRLNVQPL